MDYARIRAREILAALQSAVLATGGPAGARASQVPCEAIGLRLYLLAPATSDHLYNLEANPGVALVGDNWEVRGTARAVPHGDRPAGLSLLNDPGAEWCSLIEVCVTSLHSRPTSPWSSPETIDVEPDK